MDYPTMWCMENKEQRLIVDTLRSTKGACLDALFDTMTEKFRNEFWKNRQGSQRAYLKLGYRAIKVTIQPKNGG